MYTPYVSAEEYKNLGYTTIPEGERAKTLKKASRHIDSLTYNRIVGKGFDGLTEFQQEIIKEVICNQADFEYDNQDMLDSILSSYSINGTSMTLESGWKLYIEQGVAIKMENYALLKQTGLCCRVLRGY